MLGVIMKNQIQGEAYYNASEKDIAVVNIFFGGSTVFGEETSCQMQFKIFYHFCLHFKFVRI